MKEVKEETYTVPWPCSLLCTLAQAYGVDLRPDTRCVESGSLDLTPGWCGAIADPAELAAPRLRAAGQHLCERT